MRVILRVENFVLYHTACEYKDIFVVDHSSSLDNTKILGFRDILLDPYSVRPRAIWSVFPS